MLDVVKRLSSDTVTLQESLLPTFGAIEYWQATFVSESGSVISGGFASDRSMARRIATAEFIERVTVAKIKESPELFDKWGMQLVPTGCGFAVGFDEANTILRSVAEACERWCMSKWIDDQFAIKEVNAFEAERSGDKASNFFLSQFDRTRYFKHSVPVYLNSKPVSVSLASTVAIKGAGVFVGYSAQAPEQSNLWQHALLESYRHLLIVKNNKQQQGLFPENRIRFFAQHGKVALDQIERAQPKAWPLPKVVFHRCEKVSDGNYFIARTIVDGWRPWHLGDVSRFLY